MTHHCSDHPTLINAIGEEKMKNLVLENRQDALLAKMDKNIDRQEEILKTFQAELTRLYRDIHDMLDDYRKEFGKLPPRTGEIN